MKKVYLIMALLMSTGLTGCASLPPADLKPIEVGTGQSEVYDPANTILYFPAGKPLPFLVTASGSVFEKPLNHTETFVLKRDIYTWRDMVSFDGKTWKLSDDVMTGKIEFNFNPKNVRFSAEFNELE